MSRPSLKQLAGVFFHIGNTTFGGGMVTITVLGRELVERRQWITASDYELAFAVARVTPGTSIIAFCAAAGWLILGSAGAIASVFALTAPTAVFAVLLLQGLESGASHPLVMGALTATTAAVCGMMGATVMLIVRPFAKGFIPILRTMVIGGGAFLASWKFNVTPIPILVGATFASLLWSRLWPDRRSKDEAAG
jgi:chromate transporter